jgi:hypothetical protein
VIDCFAGLFNRQGLKIREKDARTGDIRFACLSTPG